MPPRPYNGIYTRRMVERGGLLASYATKSLTQLGATRGMLHAETLDMPIRMVQPIADAVLSVANP
jgi:hypothetical protein